MSTKAEEFRYWAERSGARKKPKAQAARRPRGAPADGGAAPAQRKGSARAGKKAQYALEVVAPGARPSRKSTRKATNRQRTDSQMRVKVRTQEVRPSRRAAMRPS
jgi:hypothetical protein